MKLKALILITAAFVCTAALYSCNVTIAPANDTEPQTDGQTEYSLPEAGKPSGTISFVYADSSISDSLSSEELSVLTGLIEGKSWVESDTSIGYDANISFTIDGNTYIPARDGSDILVSLDSGLVMRLSSSQRKIIDTIFVSHGGYFPCT